MTTATPTTTANAATAGIEAAVSEAVADLETDSLLGDFPDGPRLVGTACTQCGLVMIGSRVVCSTCVGRDLSRVALPTTGELYTYTRLHVGAEGIRPMGYVDLGTVRTLADLHEADIPLEPGMTVELGVDGDSWFFTPALPTRQDTP
ncbi:hypothetical protein HRK28_08925 [Rathayibacter sp. VKM Ac-2835]|uniref:Zn-ribbon domain-containing OB-fold protein n=1 Tax=Rathayibacter sp. VKM Ac-2835 TaxID=2739043 RepID=UPI001567AC4A|nr:hypothetical protein [Rathayibacter sp. VKM Ac-2835]NRG41045.1 hypothetical protein [Rathayibacter sp. VKM Ac-2835]